MEKFKVLITTTFRKVYEVEAESEEDALEKINSDPDYFYDATDTLDFDTEVSIPEKPTVRYIIVDIADRYYEEGAYSAMFLRYEDALNWINEHKQFGLIEKLNYLHEHRYEQRDYNGYIDLIVSYW